MKKAKTYSRKEVQFIDSDPWYHLIKPKIGDKESDSNLSVTSLHHSQTSSSSDFSQPSSSDPLDGSVVLFQSILSEQNPAETNDEIKVKVKRAVKRYVKPVRKSRRIQESKSKIAAVNLDFSDIDKHSLIIEKQLNTKNEQSHAEQGEGDEPFSEVSDKQWSASHFSPKILLIDFAPGIAERALQSDDDCESVLCISPSELVLVESNESQPSTNHENSCGLGNDKFPLAQSIPTTESADAKQKSCELERRRGLRDIQNLNIGLTRSSKNAALDQQTVKSQLTCDNSSSHELLSSPATKVTVLGKRSRSTSKPHCSTPITTNLQKLSIPLSGIKSKASEMDSTLVPFVSNIIPTDSMCASQSNFLASEDSGEDSDSSVIFICERRPDRGKVRIYAGENSFVKGESSERHNIPSSSGVPHLQKSFSKPNEIETGNAALSSMNLNRRIRMAAQRMIDSDSPSVPKKMPSAEKSGHGSVKTSKDHVSLLAEYFSVSSAQLTPKEKILKICGQDDIIMFSQAYDWRNCHACKKIGEGSYGEAYSLRSIFGKRVVIKIIPIEGDFRVNNVHQKTFCEIYSEITISKTLSEMRNSERNCTRNFIKLNGAKCLTGKVPQQLVSAWNNYRLSHGTDAISPELYPYTQLYVILEFEHGGVSLDHFLLKSPTEAQSLLQQVICTLAVAEEEYCFEHRDLHLENILLSRTSMKYIRYIFNGKKFHFPTHGVLVTIIDFTLSRMSDDEGVIFSDLNTDPSLFKGEGDYQFAIYRMIKDYVERDWRRFVPYSNVLWVHYLTKKLCKFNYLRYNAKCYLKPLEFLTKMEGNVLDFESAVDVLKDMNIFKS